jgi:glycerol-3-phosphate acyltransferase PlsX
VEGRDILTGGSPRGRVDVVVCDGFVGNVLLKFYESVPALIFKKLESSGVPKGTLAAAFQGFDYSDYGGAPLLGVNGISIISHGRSSPRAIKNAIGVALRAIESSMDQHITDKLGHGVPSA